MRIGLKNGLMAGIEIGEEALGDDVKRCEE
jgi:hypothetical protein